jgi:hypothetical protein
MNWINGICKTNIDDVVCVVDKFFAVPRKDELVMVLYKGNATYFKVVSVGHFMRDNEPYILVELTK